MAVAVRSARSREGFAPHIPADKESNVIKPFEEYSPEEHAFLEFVQEVRSRPPTTPHDPGPLNWEEVKAIAAEVPQEDRDALVEAIRRGRDR